MIELTVKTLDSHNHQFAVEDDITVEQFKIKISEKINIPPETQRIIYCGRVLQDSSKLADYDVNGKVVHLVQRAPPGVNTSSNSRSASPQPQRRGFRGFRGLEQGNAMYLGSMAFPGNLMESQGIVPPPPTHSLSGSRLNVAKRMLKRAEAVIRLLENPLARPQDHTPPEENQEEEVTPVIEARVIVPANSSEPIDEAMVLNAVQNSLMNATASGSIPLGGSSSTASGAGTSAQSTTQSAERSPNLSESSSPGENTPRSSSTENLATEGRSEANNELPENALRTSEMANLLTKLNQLQARFAPFLEIYQQFMQDDPEVSPENQRQTERMINRVSEVLHYLGHAYHSLSDIIIRVRTPRPRPLLCRPILIQHSAVVQTGIPIQVEAQINLLADRPPQAAAPNSQSSGTTSADSDTTSTASSAPSAATASSNQTATPNPSGGPSISVQPGFAGIPFLPGAAMRMQSFPVEIRTVRSASGQQRSQNNNNNTVNAADDSNRGGNATNTADSTNATSSEGNNNNNNQDRQQQQQPGQAQGQGVNFNNPNVEFFMEVTPEGITIDSLETTLVGSNQASDLLRSAINGPPPEFLQSLMQMAGQIINRNVANVTAAAPASEPNHSQQSSTQTTSSSPPPTASGQNSQARGNTQTNPTTATHTRSTARPHVHLAQQAMQGGFDPFLPCNSHHISRRRMYSLGAGATVAQAANQTNQQGSQGTAQSQTIPEGDRGARNTTGNPVQNQNVLNFINGLFDTIRTEYRRSEAQNQGQAQAAPPTNATEGSGENNPAGNGDAANAPAQNLPALASLFATLQGGGNLPDLLRQGPTLDQLLQEFQQDEQYVQGESILTDLIMLLVRNLTLVDLFSLNSGNVEPINRNSTEIQNFFRNRICEGNTSLAGIDRGVDRVITELQPFLENFSSFPVRDDIDMTRSAEQLFRQRLPNIISIAIDLNANNVRLLLDQCVTTAQQLCALALLASSTGQLGVEEVFERIMNRFMQDVPPQIQSWTFMTSRVHLRRVLSSLNVSERLLQPYIVRRSDATLRSAVEPVLQNERVDDNATVDLEPEVPVMEWDDVETTNTENTIEEPPPLNEDTEPLPNIVLGSEPWHGQVPEDWVPIIARDAQKQRRQNPQGPFSDAYLSGMPSKRRKIVTSSKPQGCLPQVITDSVRQAITSSGLTAAAPLETVAQAAGASAEIQTAYRSLLRSTVQSTLRDNKDFTPDRFPNASNYFNGRQ